MPRQIVHTALLFAGLAPAVWAFCIFPDDPRRAGVLAALAVLGLTLNGVALGYREFSVNTPMRVIASGVALIVLAIVMAMWQWVRREHLGRPPTPDVERYRAALTVSRNLVWIGTALVYVIVTILVLPGPAARRGARRDQIGKRLDSRRFHR